MSNKKTTKRALLLSVIALFICVSMLAGTTFAWFTDSVTSGKNVIVAGNLDIELTHTNAVVTNATVEGSTNLFVDKNGDAILWEPGVVVWEDFTVANVGTLALKYQYQLTKYAEVTNGGKSLEDVIKVGYTTNTTATAREDVIESVATWINISDIADAGKLVPGASATDRIVLYWAPTDHDNDYNMNNANKGKVLSIEFGLTLVATQLEYEDDSFDNTYDAAADAVFVSSANDFVAAVANGGEVALADDIVLSAPLNVTKDVVIYGQGNTITYTGDNRAIDVPNTANGADLTVKDLTIEITSSYSERAINYNTTGNLTLDNVTVSETGTAATYAVNLPGSSNGATVVIKDCDLTGKIALNIWGADVTATVTNSNLISVDDSAVEGYMAVGINTPAENTTVTFDGGSIIAKDENGNPATAIQKIPASATYTLSSTTEVVGDHPAVPVAFVKYVGTNGEYMDAFYACYSIQEAVKTAAKSTNAVVILYSDVDVDTLDVPANVTVDKAGYTWNVATVTGAGTITFKA